MSIAMSRAVPFPVFVLAHYRCCIVRALFLLTFALLSTKGVCLNTRCLIWVHSLTVFCLPSARARKVRVRPVAAAPPNGWILAEKDGVLCYIHRQSRQIQRNPPRHVVIDGAEGQHILPCVCTGVWVTDRSHVRLRGRHYAGLVWGVPNGWRPVRARGDEHGHNYINTHTGERRKQLPRKAAPPPGCDKRCCKRVCILACAALVSADPRHGQVAFTGRQAESTPRYVQAHCHWRVPAVVPSTSPWRARKTEGGRAFGSTRGGGGRGGR